MPNLRGRIQPLDEVGWRQIGDHCRHIRQETVKLYKMIRQHVPVSLLDRLLKADMVLDSVRSKLEDEMMRRTMIRDTHVFYPWQEPSIPHKDEGEAD